MYDNPNIKIFKMTEIPETYPKYDPCRKFRNRDKVRYRVADGRIYASVGSLIERIKNREYTTVIRDELQNGRVGVLDPLDEENPYYVPAHNLELITPVEEQEPYYTIHSSEEIDDDLVEFWAVRDEHDDTVAKFYVDLYRVGGAQKAAEAECSRLNEEWRKEQSNG